MHADVLPDAVAVFAAALAQQEGRFMIPRKEGVHSVRVVVMRVGEHAGVHRGEVDPEELRVSGKAFACAGVQQNAPVIGRDQNAEPPFGGERL